ncbi:procollagen-lysine,2-oxoglutarate 5-dioxygenase-like [Cloeon dipterum]|uniref:procollagen-lysine,2-oxoglutarate 5-dioxygenase-like n=1 Tax=Cloeon dipterum TaxID=197152 RepID=UPI003220421E
MYVDSRFHYGYLVSADNFDLSHVNNELYQVEENRYHFEQRYLHENYSLYLQPNQTLNQPCPDVYWFPLFKPRFCQELVAEAEANGSWVTGAYNDPVPTQDIHMEYIGLGEMWDLMLKEYILPLVSGVFTGYEDTPHCPHKFVVRYRPDQQAFLRPHHDTATYTINLALNNAKIDYEGGGCRFIRYNCSVQDTRIGWILMHPGRLTHYHEGLPVSKGTRYILVSFVDP